MTGAEMPTQGGPIVPATEATGGSAAPIATEIPTEAEVRAEIFFGRSSSQLEDDRVLMSSAKWLAAHPDIAITIEGHADPSGAPERNLALSKSRAESVKAWFVAHDVRASRIEVKAFGDTKLKYGEHDVRNRRVSIDVKRP